MAKILGISAFYHDSAATILVDGELVGAAQEERFTRRKHDPRFPRESIEFLLDKANIELKDVDYISFYDKPFLKFERLLETYLAFAPRGFSSFRKAMPIWIREKLFLKHQLVSELKKIDKLITEDKILFSEHHISHAASAFYPSPFEEALVLTLDGVGEWSTATIAVGNGNDISIKKELHFPHSLGLLYSAVTYYLGFKVNSGEYKIMGLAPYGEPRYADLILKNLVELKSDGSFRLNQKYFNYAQGLTMTNKEFDHLFGNPRRNPESEELTQFHMDMAASVQSVTESIVLKIAEHGANTYGQKNLCLAGGVALNCVANGKLLRSGLFEKIWIQPAAGDAGGSLGTAYAAWHQFLENPRHVTHSDKMRGSYLGPDFSQEEIEQQLNDIGAKFETHEFSKILDLTSDALAEGSAIGWFQGPMEFGPRALGGRSILGDPRSKSMQKTLNLKVKFRESFRPFAPSILREDLDNWFEMNTDSPYMLLVADVKKEKQIPMSESDSALFGINKLNVTRSEIPAVTHVDYSARIQTVHKETNPKYHQLLSQFKEKTGCPTVINTSFNVRGEPIVCSPKDAYRCFMGTDLDTLVIGNCFLKKSEQNPELLKSYKDQFELD